MKIVVTLIVIGSIMRLDVNESITWLRDLVCTMLLVTGLVMAPGNYYGLTVMVIVAVLALSNLIVNVINDKFEVQAVKELEERIRDYNYLIFNLEEEIKILESSQVSLNKYKEEDMNAVNIIVNDLFGKIDKDRVDSDKLINILEELKTIVNKPIVVMRSAYDFNLECSTNRQRRVKIKRIKDIKKEYDLGIEFDMQLDEMIEQLQKGMN